MDFNPRKWILTRANGCMTNICLIKGSLNVVVHGKPSKARFGSIRGDSAAQVNSAKNTLCGGREFDFDLSLPPHIISRDWKDLL